MPVTAGHSMRVTATHSAHSIGVVVTAERELGARRLSRGRGGAAPAGGVPASQAGGVWANARGGTGRRIAWLTKRRAVDFCRVATALCPAALGA